MSFFDAKFALLVQFRVFRYNDCRLNGVLQLLDCNLGAHLFDRWILITGLEKRVLVFASTLVSDFCYK
jgi:hypothetical protein